MLKTHKLIQNIIRENKLGLYVFPTEDTELTLVGGLVNNEHGINPLKYTITIESDSTGFIAPSLTFTDRLSGEELSALDLYRTIKDSAYSMKKFDEQLDLLRDRGYEMLPHTQANNEFRVDFTPKKVNFHKNLEEELKFLETIR